MSKDKLALNNLVTPQEAVKFSGHRTIEDFDVVNEIVLEFDKKKQEWKHNEFWFYSCLMATIWNAGRVQGIREERLSRKAVV